MDDNKNLIDQLQRSLGSQTFLSLCETINEVREVFNHGGKLVLTYNDTENLDCKHLLYQCSNTLYYYINSSQIKEILSDMDLLKMNFIIISRAIYKKRDLLAIRNMFVSTPELFNRIMISKFALIDISPDDRKEYFRLINTFLPIQEFENFTQYDIFNCIKKEQFWGYKALTKQCSTLSINLKKIEYM
jgi:hypothetical protein